MPRTFPSLSRALISGALCSAISLPRPARADEISQLKTPLAPAVNPLDARDDVTIKPLTQREFADAATGQISLLKEMRAWRNTLRGQGARRDWGLSLLGREKVALSLGQVAPSSLGGGAGLVAKWQRVEIGSTAQPKAIDEALAEFDSVWSGQDVKAQNPTQINWLRAQLLASKQAQVEVMAARATRVAATDARWRAGDFQSASAKFQLPAKWSLGADFSRAAVESNVQAATDKNLAARDGDAANAWGFAATGPIAHPFGVASASASWRQTDAGYVAPTAENAATGAENGALSLAQDLKIGALSGSLKFGAATRRLTEAESALAGQQLDQNSAQSAAQLRLALTPNLSVTGQGNWNTSAATRALIDQNRADDADASILTPTQARDLSRQLAGDLGVQWNFNKALSLAVTLGASSQDSHSENGETSTVSAQNDETRRALELRSKTGAGDLRLRFSQRARRNALATTNLTENSSAPISQWRIEAARPLLAGMRLKTILDYASDAVQNQSARRIEAQLQLARAARFDARYREGSLAPGLLSDEWSSIFAASNAAPKQMSARFGLGSAAAGSGLGFSLEMVRNQGALPDSYRVGVQFK